MKKAPTTIFAAFCLAFSSASLFAQDKDSSAPPVPAHEGTPGMGNKGAMGAISEEQMDAQLRFIQERMLRDYDFMRQIHEAKDEKDRAQIKDEWLKAMKQQLRPDRVPPELKKHGMPENRQ